jgi:DNA-binding transcriptional LysR family regulator
MLGDLEAIREPLAEGDALSDPLHVVAPVALWQTLLTPMLARFHEAHPGITITWRVTAKAIRLSEMGADLWLCVAAIPDDSLAQHEIGSVDRHVTASRPMPTRPRETAPWITLGPCEGRAVDLAGGPMWAARSSPPPL